jgi:uncharacterized protein YodC (DUF2158 family)
MVSVMESVGHDQTEIKEGGLVVLKSGGPQMTAGQRLVNGKIRVVWFVGHELKAADLDTCVLRAVSSKA